MALFDDENNNNNNNNNKEKNNSNPLKVHLKIINNLFLIIQILYQLYII